MENVKQTRNFDMFNGRVSGLDYSNEESIHDYAKTRINQRNLNDPTVDLATALKKVNARLTSKTGVLKAIADYNLTDMIEISNFFYRTSGIYARLCRYAANLYQYDWLLTPQIHTETMTEEDKVAILEGFNNGLKRLDDFGVRKHLTDIALKVVRDGCYYGYINHSADGVAIQELPLQYCRSRFKKNGRPTVEFNMKYFDDCFKDDEQRAQVLKIFPKEFTKGYRLLKQGKLKSNVRGEADGWFLLEPELSLKFNINNEDMPLFITVVPALLDLDEAQDLHQKKMQQQLLKIVVQQLPLDKNGELLFDVEEGRMLHNNVVKMLDNAIGVDVLTSFADVSVEDMADTSSVVNDELAKAERTVYNEAGVSQMQFNTDGNLALEKSIANDEALMRNLLLQFEDLLNTLIAEFNCSADLYNLRVQIMQTTIYNFKDMAKLYKEQTQLGYSKLLPQIALGQSQSSILASARFENEVLKLNDIFIPPQSSSTMSSSGSTSTGDGEVGRTELADDQKSEKTIQNNESMG